MGRERTASQVIGRPDAAAFNAEQRAKQPRQRTLSEMATPIGGTGNDPNAPNRAGTAARGLASGLAGSLDLLSMAGGGVTWALDKAGELAGRESRPSAQRGPSFSERAAAATGLPEPTDSLGRGIESFSRGVGGAIPFAPLAAAGAPAVGLGRGSAVIGELFAGGAGGLAQDELTESGSPNLGMGAGIVLGGMANPAAAVAGTTARRAGGAALDTVRKMTPDALAMARANELSRGAMVRGSSEIKRRTPDVVAAIDELRRRAAQTQRASMPSSPSSRQVMEGMESGRGGRFFTDAERNLTTTDVDYATGSARRYADNADELARRWEGIASGDPDYDRFLTSYDEGADVLKREERALWDAVEEGDRPSFNTADMVSQAREIAGSAVFKRANVPGSIALLANANSPMTTMNLDRFQELRSVLLGVVRDAKRTGLSADKHAAEMAGQMLDTMQSKMDDFARMDPTGKSAQWQAARARTLDNNTFYDINSPVIRTLESGGKAKNLFSTLRQAKGKRGARTNPAQEAQRLVRIAEQSPGGMENLRALAAEDLFAEGFNPSATRAPDKILRQNEDMYRVVFGDQYDQALELIDLARLYTRGSPGSPAEAYRTGSGVSPAAFLFGVARGAQNPVAAAVEGSMKFVGKQNARDLEWQRIVRTAVEQPEFLRVLLEMPTEAALPAWQVQWRQLVARSSAKETARAAARRQSERDGGVSK